MSTPLPAGHIAFPSLLGPNAEYSPPLIFLFTVINVILVNKKKNGKMTGYKTSNSKSSQKFLQ